MWKEVIRAEDQLGLVLRWVRAPQQRLDAGFQFGDADGLHHEVVGAGRQALHHVGFFATVRHKKDRKAAVEILTNPLDHIRPLHVGQAPVEDQEVVGLLPQFAQQRAAVTEAVAFMADTAHGVLDQFELARLVVKRGNTHSIPFLITESVSLWSRLETAHPLACA